MLVVVVGVVAVGVVVVAGADELTEYVVVFLRYSRSTSSYLITGLQYCGSDAAVLHHYCISDADAADDAVCCLVPA